MSESIRRAVVDNWLLEHVREAVADERIGPSEDEVACALGEGASAADLKDAIRIGTAGIMRDDVECLIKFLDVMVLYDEVVNEGMRFENWNIGRGLEDLSAVLTPAEISDSERHQIAGMGIQGNPEFSASSLVVDGAHFYHNFARIIGADYWPSLLRGRYLRKSVFGHGNGALLPSVELVEKEIALSFSVMVQEIGMPLSYRLPSFGAIVLSECQHRNEILRVANEYRLQKETKEFRRWLGGVDKSCQSGNLKDLCSSIAEVRDILPVPLSKKGKDSQKPGVNYFLGVAPGIEVPAYLVNKLMGKFRPKKLHVAFLENHVRKVSRAADAEVHIKRLYPELRDAVL